MRQVRFDVFGETTLRFFGPDGRHASRELRKEVERVLASGLMRCTVPFFCGTAWRVVVSSAVGGGRQVHPWLGPSRPASLVESAIARSGAE